MAEAKKSKKAGKGRNPAYKSNHIREKNKIVRIARSNGMDEAMKYAAKHGLTSWAKERLAQWALSRHVKQDRITIRLHV